MRTKATALVKEVTGDAQFNDVNYVFPTFVTTHMPMGLVGPDHRGDLRGGDVERSPAS